MRLLAGLGIGGRLSPYRTFLAWPGVLPVATCAYVSRLTAGMVGLSMLLLVQRGTGSFVAAGAATASYGAAVACAAPMLGRLMDRSGAPRVLLVCGALYPLSLIALVLAVDRQVGLPAILVAAAIGGATIPQTAVAVRSIWSSWLPDGPARQAAFAFESVVSNTVFVVGPLLVGIVTPVLGAEYPILFTAVTAAVGAAGVARALATSRVPRASALRGRARPLAAPGIRVVLLATATGSTLFGVVPVAVAAFARDHHQSAAAVGVLLALLSVGSIAGGLAYGALRLGLPAHRQYPWALAILGSGLAAVALARSLPELAVVLTIAGLASAAVETLELRMVASLAPEGGRTEAFGWFNTAAYLGFATGSGVAGVMVDRLGTSLAFLLEGGLILLAASGALAARRLLDGESARAAATAARQLVSSERPGDGAGSSP